MVVRVLAGCALAVAALGLSGCGEAPADPAPKAQGGIPGMTVTNPRLVLAPVAGNPAAVYFDLAYDGDRQVALNRGEVKGAGSAMFHDYGEYNLKVQMMDMLPLPIKKGDKVSFAPGGKHLMVMNPPADLKPGGTAEVSLIVSGGDKLTFSAPVKAAGDER